MFMSRGAGNRPFPSSLQPLFQSYEDQFSFILKLELITIKKNSHLYRLSLKERQELGNGLLDVHSLDNYYEVSH